jgi:inner membrane protein
MKLIPDALTRRLIAIAAIAILMLIPLALVEGIVSERNDYFHSVLRDIAQLWGQQQVIKGPVLVIPFVEECVVTETFTDDQGREHTKTRVVQEIRKAIVLPDKLNMSARLSEQYRSRGIYDSLVFTSSFNITGEFTFPDIAELSDHVSRIDWHKAYWVLGVSDTKAIKEASALNWGGKQHSLSPGTRLTEIIGSGFHAPLDLSDGSLTQHEFEIQLSINGSGGLRFAPVGETTKVTMVSSWPHPSFQGQALPTQREIGPHGFSAEWRIPHLARNYPQTWVLPIEQHDLNELLTGVDLFEPVFIYSRITRAVKYGLLFVILTFLSFLIFELSTQASLHFVQYGLIGVALSLFYLTLLSLSEHIGFFAAYLLASVITIGLITGYAASAMHSKAKAAVILLLLSGLYGVLYILLKLEDYALLTGSVVLLVVLAVLMYLTRNISPTVTGDECAIADVGTG